MTYRQLYEAYQRAKEIKSELEDVKAAFPYKGTVEERDEADAKQRSVEFEFDKEIDEFWT